jgi:hypothetical protein
LNPLKSLLALSLEITLIKPNIVSAGFARRNNLGFYMHKLFNFHSLLTHGLRKNVVRLLIKLFIKHLEPQIIDC